MSLHDRGSLTRAQHHGHRVAPELVEETERRMAQLLTTRKPSSVWTFVEGRFDSARWRKRESGLMVIESIMPFEQDGGRWWHHVSASSDNHRKLPNWKELREVKDTFVGTDREAYMVFPPRARYVNISEVLHLWHCLDAPAGAILPAFETISAANGRLTI